jgi:hypothetical protein
MREQMMEYFYLKLRYVEEAIGMFHEYKNEK